MKGSSSLGYRSPTHALQHIEKTKVKLLKQQTQTREQQCKSVHRALRGRIMSYEKRESDGAELAQRLNLKSPLKSVNNIK